MVNKDLVIVRGGGDISTGSIQKLYRSGFNVLVLEIEKPTAIRRTVAFSEAVFKGEIEIEGIKGRLVKDKSEIFSCFEDRIIPIVIDEKGKLIEELKPKIVVDGILAKKNLGTKKDMAKITVAIGPGFVAGKDVDVVVETMRGHKLGTLIFEGSAMANTGTPGEIAGVTKERVIYSDYSGEIENIKEIGDIVKKGEVIAKISDNEVYASIDGLLRGLISDGMKIYKGLKIADIDPRLKEVENYTTISDKARSIGGGVLEAILYMKNERGI